MAGMASTSGSILGTRVHRSEDPKLLTTGGDWISNLRLPNAVHVTYVRSTVAHGRIISVDVDEARQAPGVVAVFTSGDLDLAPAPPAMPMFNKAMTRPRLAQGVVRYVGEPIVAIASETKAAGVDAAELVVVEYDTLATLLDVDASRSGDVVLFPDAGSNIAWQLPCPADEATFAGCEVVVELTIENQRLAPAPMEVRATAARWEGDQLTYWGCGQGAHGTRDGVAAALGLDKANVRVITPDVGGGFGAKSGAYVEEYLVAWIARRLDRPAVWNETRSENLVGMGHGRGQRQRAKLGGSRDGHMRAYRLEVSQDAGAYPELGALLPVMTRTMAAGVYDLQKVEFDSVSVVTNTTPMTAYRGAGRPEATAAIERMVDLFAAEIAIDPAEVRRKNLPAADRFPFTTASGATYDTGNYVGALDKALAAAGYAELRAEQARRRSVGDTRLLGIGLASYVEITNPIGSGDFGSVEITPDGGAIARTGSSPHGQGHYTVWKMIVHDKTGIPMDRIEIRHGDTTDIPRGGGTGGSRSLQVGGSAVQMAAEKVVDIARQRAADLLEAAVDDIVLDAGQGVFHVAGTPSRALSWADVAAKSETTLREDVDFKPAAPSFPFGTHVSVVEVDAETGRVTVLRHVACDDAGRIINPLIVDGQVHGGVGQGIAQALLEEVRYDDDGNPITANLADYAFISAAELPSYERVVQETPTPLNPLGAKGIGEAGTIGATPAVHNAVIDAVAHLGVRHIDMPCTAEKVWRAIQGASG